MSEALRDRTRRAVREEITDVAMGLFVAHGFEATGVAQIAEAAGISRRSLFRYFESKEDVVLGGYVVIGERLRDRLKERPHEEDPWDALRSAFQPLLPGPEQDSRAIIELTRLCLTTPSLQAGHLEKHRRWQELLVPIVQERIGGQADVRASAIVAAAISCLDLAITTWVQADGAGDPGAIYDQAVAAVRK